MKKFLTFAVIALFAGLSACGGSTDRISGSGATFPYPLYSKMFDEYYQAKEIIVDYNPIGSSGGIQDLLDQMVDFGATDKPMGDEDLADAEAEILHVPTCLGAVVVTYNLPNAPELKLTSDLVADIFMGNISKWNDEAIAAINPDVELPDMDIEVVTRSDGSGTTFIFTDFLTAVSEEWAGSIGKGKSVNWPSGVAYQGNPGVSGYINVNEGTIGYVELSYAIQQDMPVASIQNSSGNFIYPDTDAVSLAADVELPADTRVSLVNTDAAQGYPISSFTWLIIYKDQNYKGRSKEQATATVDLIWWMTHEAQQYAPGLDYAPLPDRAVTIVENILNSVEYDGEKIR